MLLQRRNFTDFYTEIRDKFPKIKELEVWDRCDWSLNGYENSEIVSEVVIEMANWVARHQLNDAQMLMNIIEGYLHDGDTPVTSIIYSDFLVTIMEVNKEPRELIKKMMGPETKKQYISLLDGYRELDQ